MNFAFRFLIMFILAFTLLGCGNVRNTPIRTIENQIEQFHLVMEERNSAKYAGQNYQSLAYGEMKVFKPASFVQLDSIYTIKRQFLDKNDMRGLRNSGIDELIPGYRAAAQEEIHLIRYEIEHLYQTSDEDSLHIYHDYFLFDYKDSLISVTPLYGFKIPIEFKDFYYAYQFNYHFVDDRDLYISKAEQDFIQFFQQRELSLIGEEELDSFMTHTMQLMAYSKKAGTVDFREVMRWVILDYLINRPEKITLKQFGELFSIEDNDVLVGYEVTIEWLNEMSGVNMETTLTFSPYLEIIGKEDKKVE